MSDFPERIGRAIGELDIDFSSFTFVGGCVSVLSLSAGLVAALGAYFAVRGRIADDRGAGLVFGLTMIATTVVSFLVLRFLFAQLGIKLTKRDV